jgi:hypothetical protein
MYHVTGGRGKRVRFDWRLLDAEDPFEIDDGNRPHLHKHLPDDGRGRIVPSDRRTFLTCTCMAIRLSLRPLRMDQPTG